MLKKNLLYNSLLSVTQFIFPLITFPYSSRILGPGGIGSVNFIDSITAYFVLFAALGIPTYGIRETAKRKNNKEELNKFVSELMLIHITSVAVFSLFYLATGLIVPTLRAHLDLIFVGIGLLWVNVITVEWFFQGIEMFQYTSLRSLVSRTLSVVFLYVFLKKGSPSIVYYLIGASGPTLNGLINIVNFRKHAKINFSALSIKETFKKHFKPLVTILGSSLAISVYALMDSIILGFIKGDVEVGLYSTALRIVRIPFAVIGAISAVMIPQVSQAYHARDTNTVSSLIHKSFSFISVIGIPIAVGMFLEADFLINFFAGKTFADAIGVLELLSPVIIFVGFTNIFALQILNPIGQERLLFKAVFIGMIFSIISNLCLIPLFSYKGAGVTFLLTEGLVPLLSYFFARRFVEITLDTKIFLQCLFGSALFFPIALAIRSLKLEISVTELLIIASCTIFYCIYVWFFVKNTYITNIKQLVLNKLPFKVARA